MLSDPVLVLAEAPAGTPTVPTLDLLTLARTLTSGDVVALVVNGDAAGAASQLGAYGATRVLDGNLGEVPTTLAVANADAIVSAARMVKPAGILVNSDFRGKQAAGRVSILLNSACISDAAEVSVENGQLHASKLVLSGSWSTTFTVSGHAQNTPVICVRPGAVEATPAEVPTTPSVEHLDVELSEQTTAIRVISRVESDGAAGLDPAQARTVVVGGRGVDGDFELVKSLAEPLEAAVGATRVACDEGWIGRSAQIGQTGLTIAPRLYIGLGVSGAVHHTSGIQGAGTIVAICDVSEAPIFEMADFGVVGDVTEVVPQLVEELGKLRG